MSWRERYKNHEARFDHHIKTFQHKNKLSRQAIPMGSEAMLVSGMEDLDDFGTDEEDKRRRPQGKRPARVDSDTEDEDWEPTRAQPRPAGKAVAIPEQPASKRKRVSDTSDRTLKRTRVVHGGRSGGTEGESTTNGPIGEGADDAMNLDSQGEETLEVEQNLFYPSDEDSLTIPRWVASFSYSESHNNSYGIAHRRGLPNHLGPVVQWRPLPRTGLLPNLFTGLTVPNTLHPVFSRQSTSMKPTRTRQLSPSAFGNEQSRR